MIFSGSGRKRNSGLNLRKEHSLKIKLLICFFILGAVLFTNKAYAQYRFFSGKDWNGIAGAAILDARKTEIKLAVLKSVYEAGLFNGDPIFNIDTGSKPFLSVYGAYLSGYIKPMDDFYGKQENINFPVFFALRIADMTKHKASDQDIETFKLSVVAKLKEQGLWQE